MVKEKIKKISVKKILYDFINVRAMKKNKIRFGDRFIGNGIIKFLNYGDIEIGNNVTVNSGASANVVGARKTAICCMSNAYLKIGDNCGLSNCVIYAYDKIIIENDVFIGGGTEIYDTDFHSLDYKLRLSGHSGAHAPVIIKKGAFIGAKVIILKGITIGEKSIIGAGSVVTKNIPDGEIWAGNPARRVNNN